MKRLTKAWPVGLQLLGITAFQTGLFMLLGPAWTLIVGGLVLATLGTLKEGGYLDGSGQAD